MTDITPPPNSARHAADDLATRAALAMEVIRLYRALLAANGMLPAETPTPDAETPAEWRYECADCGWVAVGKGNAGRRERGIHEHTDGHSSFRLRAITRYPSLAERLAGGEDVPGWTPTDDDAAPPPPPKITPQVDAAKAERLRAFREWQIAALAPSATPRATPPTHEPLRMYHDGVPVNAAEHSLPTTSVLPTPPSGIVGDGGQADRGPRCAACCGQIRSWDDGVARDDWERPIHLDCASAATAAAMLADNGNGSGKPASAAAVLCPLVLR